MLRDWGLADYIVSSRCHFRTNFQPLKGEWCQEIPGPVLWDNYDGDGSSYYGGEVRQPE